MTIRLTNDAQIDCLLDTGFNGTLFLPREFVEENDLPFGVREVLQAAEDQIFEVDTATAEVEWMGDRSSKTVFVSETGEALVGAEMFVAAVLEIDYRNRLVKITK